MARNPYRQKYKDADYTRNRRHAFERAHGKCQACGLVLQPGDWECDHRIPIRDGGTNDIINLLILCKPCHRAKTAAERRARNT